MNSLLHHEVNKYNLLMSEINKSMVEIVLASQGQILLTFEIEKNIEEIQLG